MTELRKELSLYGLTMVAIGSCIGSGIFITPSQIASHLPSPTLILIVWTVGGIIALTGALTFAELGGMFPKAGGVYVYLKEAYGDIAGFMYGWAYFTVINSGAIAALCIAFSYYLSFIFPMSESGKLWVAILAIVCITVINIFRVKLVEYFSNLFTGLKLIGISIVIGIGLFMGSFTTVQSNDPLVISSSGSLLSAFGLALVGVLWSYGGWQHASYLSGEAKNASSTIPKAMVIGAFVVTVVYMLTNLSYLFLMPVAEMARSESIAADAVSKVVPNGGFLVAVIIAISTLGTALIYTLSAPRIYFAMARDGLFFKKIAEVHPKYQTPVNSVILQSIWAIVILIFWGTFEDVITYVTFTDWIFFTLAACVFILFRFKRKEAHRPYKTLGYPFTPLVFILISSWFVINTLIERPLQAGAGLTLLLIGLPLFYFFKKKQVKSG